MQLDTGGGAAGRGNGGRRRRTKERDRQITRIKHMHTLTETHEPVAIMCRWTKADGSNKHTTHTMDVNCSVVGNERVVSWINCPCSHTHTHKIHIFFSGCSAYNWLFKSGWQKYGDIFNKIGNNNAARRGAKWMTMKVKKKIAEKTRSYQTNKLIELFSPRLHSTKAVHTHIHKKGTIVRHDTYPNGLLCTNPPPGSV